MASETPKSKTSSIDSKFPIAMPWEPALFFSEDDFQHYIVTTLASASKTVKEEPASPSPRKRARNNTSQTSKISGFEELEIISRTADEVDSETGPESPDPEDHATANEPKEGRFIQGLKDFTNEKTVPSTSMEPMPSMENKMLTENLDVANRSSLNPLVDLFYELEEVVSGKSLYNLLNAAWAHDKDATLKIVFNARSVHLGKASRSCFYRSCGWLATEHPRTLLANLKWLVRPVIEKPKWNENETKKTADKDEAENLDTETGVGENFELVDANADFVDSGSWIKEQGLAHGYWKDILNLLVLAVNDELRVLGNPAKVLSVQGEAVKKHKRVWNQIEAKTARDLQKADRHERAIDKFENNHLYRLLHLNVARLFADQLTEDLKYLNSGLTRDKTRISLAAKWAPTLGGFHDQHTFITSSIAEILYPKELFADLTTDDRELYLKHSRERYRRDTLGPLRKYIDAVERAITAKKYDTINYSRIPSFAMQRYSKVFIEKDEERFGEYLDSLGEGKTKISGAVLLPSTLVAEARASIGIPTPKKGKGITSHLVAQRQQRMMAKVANGQWNTLVQRIKDSGTLSSAIAVCDVSGSMSSPRFPDGTCPMDSAIGLSLLVAEVTQPPFGGHFITFSENPQLVEAGGPNDKRDFKAMVQDMEATEWGASTNFEAVFIKLILPMAVKRKLKQEDMVKTVFVFSDMQFNMADRQYDSMTDWSDSDTRSESRWSTSYKRIKDFFELSGYKVPQMVFWNLAGGRAGYVGSFQGDPTAPKPVTSDEEGTVLVSGYSQGQLKVFLDGGGFEDVVEEEIVQEEGEDGVIRVGKEKKKMDPLSTVMKAIGHEAYWMLKALD